MIAKIISRCSTYISTTTLGKALGCLLSHLDSQI